MQTYNTYCFNATDVSKTNRHTDIDTHTQTNAHTHTQSRQAGKLIQAEVAPQ